MPESRPPTCKRTIMIAVDGSEHSKYAVKWALDNIVRNDGTDWVLLVTCKSGDIKGGKQWGESSVDEAPAIVTSPKDEVDNAEKSRLQNILNTYMAEVSKRMISGKSVILKGDPKISLIGKADEARVDIMVMGSRGLGSFKKLILGSVSDYCVNNAPCPVLIVRKPAVY